jgi:hypothetical protein
MIYGKYRAKIYSISKNYSQNISDDDLMVYATKLIYSIRKFLNNGEEIMFHFGVKGPDGKFASEAYVS